MAQNFDEFLLEQIRGKDEVIWKLRMELARLKAAQGDVEYLELIPCEETVQ